MSEETQRRIVNGYYQHQYVRPQPLPGDRGDTALTTAKEPSGFSFAGRVLDLRNGELRSHGRRVHLEYRALAVLIYLLHHRSRVVSRQELVEAVWDVRYLSDNALSRAVSLVRSALKDQARPHRFIATCYGEGYRFVAPVRELEASDLDTRSAGTSLRRQALGDDAPSAKTLRSSRV